MFRKDHYLEKISSLAALAVLIPVFSAASAAGLQVETLGSSGVTTGSFVAEGNVTGLGSVSGSNVSFQYREEDASTWNWTVNETVSSTGVYNITISGLNSNTTYEFRTYAENSSQGVSDTGSILKRNTTMLKTVPGGTIGFQTTEFNMNTLTITNNSNVGTSWLRFKGNVSTNLDTPAQFNFSYRKKGASTWNTVKAEKAKTNEIITERVNGLEPATTYEYIIESSGQNATIQKVNTTMMKTIPGGTIGFSTSCSLNSTTRLEDNTVLNTRNGCNGFNIGSNGLYSSSGDLTFKARDLSIESGGEITAADLQVFAYDLDLAEVESINAAGKGSSGGNGTVFLCSTVPSVSCRGTDDSGVNLNVSLNKTSDGLYRIRNITEDWSTGYLNWTENVSMTSKYDSDWSGAIEANYAIDNLTQNQDFKVLKDGNVIETENSGSDGTINFSTTLTGKHRFEVLESENPEWSNQAQEKNLIGLGDVNNLTANLSDVGSGVSKLYLATNESGTWKNRTEYTKSLPNIKSSTEAGVEWSSTAFQGQVKDISWRFYFRDAAGNWNSTDTKTFTIDGKAPSLSGFSFPEIVDVDNSPVTVTSQASDSPAGLDLGVLKENSSGSFANRTVALGNDPEFSASIDVNNPKDVRFTAYVNDTLGNTVSRSGTIDFRNITIDLTAEDNVLSGGGIDVSGSSKLLPDDVPVDGPLNAYVDTGGGFQKTGTVSVNTLGNFASEVSSPYVAGTHVLKLNYTDSNGISGLATERFNVSLNVSSPEALFADTGTAYADVVEGSRDVNLTVFVSNSTDSKVSKVEAKITLPNGSTRKYSLSNTADRSSSGTWYKVIDTASEFQNLKGRFDVSYTAETGRGIGSNIANTSFYIRNVSIDAAISDGNVTTGENFTLSGSANLQPSGENLNGTLMVEKPSGTKDIDVADGVFSSNISVSEPGRHSINISYTTANGIVGNATVNLDVFNITARIEKTEVDGVVTDTVFKDSSSDVDLNFSDVVKADSENPAAVKNLDLKYDFPSGFNIRETNPFIGTLNPGETANNSPAVDIGTSIKPGNYTVRIYTESEEKLVSENSTKIRVFTKSESEYTNIQDGAAFSREKSNITVRAKVIDVVGGAPLEGINTSLIVRDSGGTPQQRIYSTSNSTGGVSFVVNLSSLEEEKNKVMTMRTLDQPSLNVNSSEGSLSNRIEFDLQGQMALAQQPKISPVQRRGVDSSSISGVIVDSTGSPVKDAVVTVELPNQTLQTNTTTNGGYSFSYNPDDRVKPGLKTLNFTAEKKSFTTFHFQDTVEVRGNLSIEGRVAKDYLQRGSSELLKSVVRNSFDEKVNGSVVWTLNSTNLGSGKEVNALIPADLERGTYNLNATTNRQYYDDDSYSKQVKVMGLSSVELTPNNFSINPGNSVEFSATVTNQTGGAIENYPVSFYVNGSEVSTVKTNASGVATFTQSFDRGVTDVRAVIDDSEGLLYNASDSSDLTRVRAEKRLILDKYKLSENDIYRYLRTPFRTVITVKLLETTDSPDLQPAAGERLNVTVNGSETVSCTTDADGTCKNTLYYNPGSVSVGNLTARAQTFRDGWANVNMTRSLVVRGDLNLNIQNPSNQSNIARGSNISLEASVTSSETGDVQVPVNWTLGGEKIGKGEQDYYEIPAGAETGRRELRAVADAPFYRSDSEFVETYVLGSARPVITRPDNSSEKGYGDRFQVSCEVRSSGVAIEGYPMEFITNSSGSYQSFDSGITSGSGAPEATASWNPINEVTNVSVGCRIDDNRTLGFTATDTIDTRLYTLFDNKPPEISNLEVNPNEVDPGSKAVITFNASEESSIRNVNVDVINPQLEVIDVNYSKISENGYRATYTAPQSEGAYSAVVTVNDSAGNFARDRKSFQVNPGGNIVAQTSKKVLENMRSDSASSFNIEVNTFVNETADNLNITADTGGGSTLLNFNTSKYNCGDLSQGSYCNRTFEVTVPAGTSPTENSPIFSEFRANWKSGDGQSSTSAFTEIVVEPNAVLEMPSARTGDTTHTSRANITVELKSRGNVPVRSIRPEFKTSDPLRTQLYGFPTQLSSGDEVTTKVGVGVPTGTSPGTYTGTLEIDSDNAPRETTELSVTVPEDPGYRRERQVSAGAVSRSSGILTRVRLNSTGNIDISFSPSFVNGPSNAGCGQRLSADDFTLEKQSVRNITVRYDFGGFAFQGNCNPEMNLTTQGEVSNTKTVDLSIDVLRFTVDKEVEKITARPGDTASFNFSASLGGEPATENISVEASLGSKEIENFNKSLHGDNFTVEYIIPEVEDAATHDLKFNVTSTTTGVTVKKMFGNAVTVPDLTPPEFGEFKIEDLSPNKTLNLDVPVSDNSEAGVENVSVTLKNNGSRTIYLEKEINNWTASIEDLDTGVYTAKFKAVDAAGLKTEISKKFRVSKPVTFNGTFTSPSGNTANTKITLVDTLTGDKTQVDTSADGKYNATLRKGKYNLKANVESSEVSLNEAEIKDNSSFQASELEPSQAAGLTPKSVKARVMGIAAKTNIESASGTVTFDYSDRNLPAGTSPADLKVAYCSSLNYTALTCGSDIRKFNVSVLNVNRARQTITMQVPGFSSYTLYLPSDQEQGNQTQQDNQQNQNNQQNNQQQSSNSGGGGGGLTNSQYQELQKSTQETQEKIQELSELLNQSESSSVGFSSNSITAKLKPGESKVSSITITNKKDKVQVFEFEAKSPVAQYMDYRKTINIPPGESKTLKINITAPASQLPGSYSGSMKVTSSSIDADIPVNIQILPPDKKLLDLSVDPVFSTVQPGKTMKVETTFNNQGYAKNIDVTIRLNLRDPETNETLSRKTRTVAVGTTLNKVFNLEVPEDISTKRYTIRASASYTNLNISQSATAVTPVKIATPFWQRTMLGLTYKQLGGGFLITLITILLGYSGYAYREKKLMEKKRYLENIDLDTIPSGGDRQGFIGELAEMGKRTFINIDDLKTHALIAGATGSGKTVTGQVMVEEALEEGANVIVLDPTAQWTGFLRENKESEMLQLLQDFGMSKDDAKAYDGNIRAVEPDEEEIDITPYLEEDEEGNIIIFSLHKLDSKNIEEFVDTTIQQIFDANLPERDHLETLVVYDEVHRLLEKFGGSGQGLKQLERGAREFRKWGVGMVLLSQVISDFSGEIRANIGTTVQMRTQYDDDLERMKDKFGMDTVKSIAKAEQGSGMLENSDYNHGRPYFVNFRPLKHSPHRLSDEELENYEEYNRRIDEMEEKVDELEDRGEDVYEYRNKIKLARRNLRKGSFSLIDIYLDELEGDLNQ